LFDCPPRFRFVAFGRADLQFNEVANLMDLVEADFNTEVCALKMVNAAALAHLGHWPVTQRLQK
jgi:hypothetical protein